MADTTSSSYTIKRSAPPISDAIRHRARYLRKAQTESEYRLWFILRGKRLGVKFRRQQVIGPYIVDFYCSEFKIVIEADGGQHGGLDDQKRDMFLQQEGMIVLRFWNNDIMQNPHGIFLAIEQAIKDRARKYDE